MRLTSGSTTVRGRDHRAFESGGTRLIEMPRVARTTLVLESLADHAPHPEALEHPVVINDHRPRWDRVQVNDSQSG